MKHADVYEPIVNLLHWSKEGVGAEVLQKTTPGPRGCRLGQGQLQYTFNLPKIGLKSPKIALSRLKLALSRLKSP